MQPSVRTSSEGSPLVLLVALVAGLGAVAYAVLPRFGGAWRLFLVLERFPFLFLIVSGIVAALVLPHAYRDCAATLHRDYRPAPMRIQALRSSLYGLAALLSLVGLTCALLPRLLLVEPQLLAPVLCVLWAVDAVAAWLLCFRPRRFRAASLPTFQEAAHLLRYSNDFILGRGSTDWKMGPSSAAGDPYWCVLPEAGVFGNVYCLGGIGSGKTHTVVKPWLEQALFKWSGEGSVLYNRTPRPLASLRCGLFVLDYKGNQAKYVTDRARAHGRAADVMVITAGGEWSINPLANGTPQQVAQKLVAALEVMTAQESHSYYRKMQLEFATHALSVLAEVLGPGKATLRDLYDFTTDPEVQSKILAAAKPGDSLSYRWFRDQWAQEDARERLVLTKGFRADLSQFVTPELAPTFARAGNFPGWGCIPNDGRIVVFSMNVDEWGPVARALGVFMLIDFQLTMLARTTTKYREQGGNCERLVLCFADEVWAYMNPGLAEFTAVSREARCCTLALHQSLAQVPETYRPTMIGNFRTPLILGINDPLSTAEFSRVFGTHRVFRKSRSVSAGYAGVSEQLLSGALLARAGGESRSVSESEAEVEELRFTPDELTRIPKFHAVAQVFDGSVVREPALIALVPGHEALLA